MIVVMKVGILEIEIECIGKEFVEWGFIFEKIVGKYKVVMGLVGEIVGFDFL